MDQSQQEVIEQLTVTLPFLDDEVPALSLADGRLYIPVYAVCHALGIRADIYIRRWQRLALWITARKLPLQTEKRGKRLVWCLLISEMPYLYSLFDWALVSPERRLQLRLATEKQVKLSALAYQEMQQQYKAMRQALFTFLTTFANIDALLQHYMDVLSPTLNDESSLALSSLIGMYRAFSAICEIRTLTKAGYARFRDFLLYGERGLAGKKALINIFQDTLALEYGEQPLAKYSVEWQPDDKHLLRVGNPRLYDHPYQSPQVDLWPPEAVEWFVILKAAPYGARPRHKRSGRVIVMQPPLLLEAE